MVKMDIFDRDVLVYGGYQYTKSKSLSSHLALQRSLDAMLATDLLVNRSVLDMGCGDGFFTIRLWDKSRCKSMIGVDSAANAIKIADIDKKDRPIKFMVGDVQSLPFSNDSFDIVLLQSVLHHMDDPIKTIREAFRLAPLVLIHESNGNSIPLQIITKVSRYHKEHNEKVFSPRRVAGWVHESGGTVVYRKYANFVPMFCGERVARLMKFVEPLVENAPLLKCQLCSVFVSFAKRRN
jgi:SAM-dependent methyltransferase